MTPVVNTVLITDDGREFRYTRTIYAFSYQGHNSPISTGYTEWEANGIKYRSFDDMMQQAFQLTPS